MAERKLTMMIDLQDNASSEIGKVDDKLSGVGKKFESLGKGMGKVGKSLTKKVTLPLVGVGAASLKTVSDFDDGMSRVRGLTGATGEEFDQLREKAIELGKTTAYSASDASEGMQILAASGMEVNDIMETSGDMFTLMSAGAVDADTAASVLTNTMSQFKMEASESSKIVDAFSQGAASAKVGVDDLEYAMGIAGASMANMNMTIDESVAMVGQLANAGVPVQQVGTMINAMANDVTKNAGAFEDLGIAVYDATGEMRPMGAILGDLEGKLEGLDDKQRDAALGALFTGQAQRGVNAFLQEGSEAYNSLTGEIEGATGAGERFAEENENNIGGALRSMSSSIETFMINVGDAIAPTVQKVADFIGNLADKFSELDPEMQNIIVKIGALVAVIPPLLSVGGRLIEGITSIPGKIETMKNAIGAVKNLSNPYVLAVLAVIAVGVLLYRNWDTIKEKAGQLQAKWHELRGTLSQKINAKVDMLKDKFESAYSSVKSKWDGLKTMLGEKLKGTVNLIKDNFARGVSFVREKWDGLKTFLANPIQGTVSLVKSGWNKITGRKGRRTGENTVPYDNYPVNLHRGEMVLTASAAKQWKQAGGDKRRIPKVSKPQTNNNSNIQYSPQINVTVSGDASSETAREFERRVEQIIEREREIFFAKLELQGV